MPGGINWPGSSLLSSLMLVNCWQTLRSYDALHAIDKEEQTRDLYDPFHKQRSWSSHDNVHRQRDPSFLWKPEKRY